MIRHFQIFEIIPEWLLHEIIFMSVTLCCCYYRTTLSNGHLLSSLSSILIIYNVVVMNNQHFLTVHLLFTVFIKHFITFHLRNLQSLCRVNSTEMKLSEIRFFQQIVSVKTQCECCFLWINSDSVVMMIFNS